MRDTETMRVPAAWLRVGSGGRDPASQEAALARQFLAVNGGILRDFGMMASVDFDRRGATLSLTSSRIVGAMPLLSPVTGRADLGLVVEPRFAWSGIGAMMGQMGWRVVPDVLPLPLLPRSARDIPRWVISATVLVRLQALLDSLERRFEMREAVLAAPRGGVNWRLYAARHMPHAEFLRVPCRVPDLRDDRDLLAAIHSALRLQRESLISQSRASLVVSQLLALCDALLRRVSNVPPRSRSSLKGRAPARSTVSRQVFRDGLQAIEWTEDERGLAGLSELRGLPWMMPMDGFFEAWLETLAERFVQRNGGRLRVGRHRQTARALDWYPPYVGSQRSLIPDIMVERGGATWILDAKYKQHWQELTRSGWSSLDQTIREHHREDLLQVLAYANLPATESVTVILVYPCRAASWEAARNARRTHHVAELRGGCRRIRVVLTAVPMEARFTDDILTIWREILEC